MSDADPLRPEDPRRLGAYALEGRLGQGGQGAATYSSAATAPG